VQPSSIVGFSVDDHLIRGLMIFTEMISRKFFYEDVIWKGGAPNYFHERQRAQRRFKFILCFEFESRKAVLSRGIQLLVKFV
jgi:hypothetical protein